jgi:hypothetical protein
MRYAHEVSKDKVKWVGYNKAGGERRWYGLLDFCINWDNNGYEIRENTLKKYPNLSWDNLGWKISNESYYFKKGITWSDLSTGKLSARIQLDSNIFDSAAPCAFSINENLDLFMMGFLNSCVANEYLNLLCPSLHFNPGKIKHLPVKKGNISLVENLVSTNVETSKHEWNSKETSKDFTSNEVLKHRAQDLEDAFGLFTQYWTNKFFQLHRNEEELNLKFIEIYGLQEELTPDVPLEEITILQDELEREALKVQNSRLERDSDTGLVTDYSGIELKFDAKEVFAQFISYAVGCMFGRYSLDKEGLILANQGETLEDYFRVIAAEVIQSPTFLPDADNIIPILDDEWFEDDIVSRFKEFLRVTFGKENLEKNLAFVESAIGKDIRKYFVKDFYNDHVKRYKKRPIYWMFSSPKGNFKALIYMHRYQPDLCSKMLNDYLQPFISKLEAAKQTNTLLSLREEVSAREKTIALKEVDRLELMIRDCKDYERTLFAIATQKITIDLDDGVKVNYLKFKDVLVPIKGLEKEED